MKPNWTARRVNDETRDMISGALGIDKYISSILVARGLDTVSDAYDFLNPRLSSLYSPFLMKGMAEAVARIRRAVERKEHVGIFSDSDLDGLTSLTILLNLFRRLGIEPYCRYAVFDEEYGLRPEVIREMKEKKIDLIITLDCGIRDVSEVALARSLGMDVIVCDHHEQGESLPDAVIVNPKQRGCPYPFKELAGVGVAFKLCHGILMSYLQSFNKRFLLLTGDSGKIYFHRIKNGIVEDSGVIDEISRISPSAGECENVDNYIFYDIGGGENQLRETFKENKIYNLNDLINACIDAGANGRNYTVEDMCRRFNLQNGIFRNKGELVKSVFSEIEYSHSQKIGEFIGSTIDLVSLGTIADIMPVNNENRILVAHGVKSMNSTTHPGLSLLVNRIGSRLSSKNIAWEISPLLNTPGRFGRTDLTALFFIERDIEKLIALLNEIDALNSDRKKIINGLLGGLYRDIESGIIDTRKNLVWIDSREIPDGLTGLIANRISEMTCKPVIIVSNNGKKDYVKGSGRSMGVFNFFSYVEPLGPLFERMGGHPNAFGFTARINNLDTIRERIETAISGKYRSSNLSYFDTEIPLDAVNIDFINRLNLFEPHGFQNEECVFLTRNAPVREFRKFGTERNHGKYTFVKSNGVEAIGWNMAEIMEKCYTDKKNVDIIFKLEINNFNDRVFPRMLILDID